MATRTIKLTQKQADLLMAHEQKVSAAMAAAGAAGAGVFAAFDNIPEGAVMKELSTDPPQVTIEYETSSKDKAK